MVESLHATVPPPPHPRPFTHSLTNPPPFGCLCASKCASRRNPFALLVPAALINPQLPTLLTALAIALSGCDQPQIRAYQAPKDEPSPLPVNQAAAPSQSAQAEPHTDAPKWTKPAGWTEQPASGMRAGSFTSAEKDGERADISVITFGGAAGGMLANVNRWRGQIALPEVDDAGLAALLQPLEINSEKGVMLDMAGEQPPPGKTKLQRTTAAIVEHGGSSWFFKMTGENTVVAGEKAAFTEFIKSVQFH